jgi:hypothetical protein
MNPYLSQILANTSIHFFKKRKENKFVEQEKKQKLNKILTNSKFDKNQALTNDNFDDFSLKEIQIKKTIKILLLDRKYTIDKKKDESKFFKNPENFINFKNDIFLVPSFKNKCTFF